MNFDGTPHPSTQSPGFGVHQQPAEIPHLLQLLVNVLRQERPAEAEEIIQKARPFLDFSVEHLRVNRPVQLFPLPANYGIRLSDNRLFSIAPGLPEQPGDMQDSQAVPVTQGDLQPHGPGSTSVGIQ